MLSQLPQPIGAQFASDLQVSLVPRSSGGSSTPTFTRATVATVQGYGPTAVIADGPILLTVASGEARFVGARRIAQDNWSILDANGVALTTTNGASSLSNDANGPLGYLVEDARTNAILQSNTLGTTWTVSNALDMNAVAADAYVSVDGATTMDKLQPKATTAVHSLNQAFTFTAAKYTTSADLRYVAATPQRWVALICNDGTTTWGASFDLLNGVVGAVSAGATSTIEATAFAGVYRCSVTNTANAAAAAGTVKISLNATDTATLESAARAGTETLGAGMVQHEIGTFKSSRIITTTVAVTRNMDALTYPSAGNINYAVGTIYSEGMQVSMLNSGVTVGGAGEDFRLNWLNVPGPMSFYDGTNNDTLVNGPWSANAIHKIATAYGGSSVVGYLDAVSAGAKTFDGSLGSGANFTVGSSNGAQFWFGTIRFLRIYPVALPAAKLQAMTAL